MHQEPIVRVPQESTVALPLVIPVEKLDTMPEDVHPTASHPNRVQQVRAHKTPTQTHN